MKHVGIVACSAEGAALCYRAFCREALGIVGRNDHPRVTMDSIPLARWMPAFDAGDYAAVARVMLDSARLLAGAGADPRPRTSRPWTASSSRSSSTASSPTSRAGPTTA